MESRRKVVAAYLLVAAAMGAFTATLPAFASADDSESDTEKRAKLMRKGAGLSVGHWALQGAREAAGAENSQTLSFEGFMQKGIDLHLALENSIGFWKRTQKTDDQTVKSYVIPNITSIRFYPFTRPEDTMEPFIRAGIGVALGIDSESGDPGGLFGIGADGGGTTMLLGFGFHAGGGVDWRAGSSFGLSASARYQWYRFEQSLGGTDTYKGIVIHAGLSYRFQYD